MRVRLKLQLGGAQQIKFYYLIQIIYIILHCAINESHATSARSVERNSIDSKWAANSLTDRHHITNEYSEYAFVIGGHNNNRHVRSKSESSNKERKTRSPHRHPHSYHYHHRQRHEVAADEEEDVERKRTALSSTVESFARQQQQQVNLAGAVASNGSESASSSGSVQRDYMAAVIGKDVQLDCRMKNLANDDDKIVWLKMPKGEVLTLNSNRVTSDARVNTRCISNSVPCWSLIITNTRESDTGFYVCQTNAMQTKYVYLDIMVPPKLLTQYPVDRIDVNQSSNATITCEFYGKPDPLIKWYKYNNGVQKEIEKFRGSKTISFYIHKDSSSEYECVADNSIPPTVSKKIYLNIQYAPQIKFLNSKVFQKKGERVIFDCNVNSNPLSKIYWYKNQTRIYESYKFNFENLDDSYHRLYINNLTDGDFGDYYCTAVNILGKSTSKIQLIELKSPNEHKKPTSSSSSKPSTTIQTTSSSLQTTSSIATQSSTPEDRFEGYQSPFWPTNDLFGVATTTTTASSSTVETNQNETVIRISLNRDKLDYYDQPLEDKKFEQITSSTRTKSQSVAKLPTYRSNTKHHLHNKTKAITKNQRKQIQKPYVNSPNNKPASSTSSISSIYSETSGAVKSTNLSCYSLPFISFHLLAILFYSYL